MNFSKVAEVLLDGTDINFRPLVETGEDEYSQPLSGGTRRRIQRVEALEPVKCDGFPVQRPPASAMSNIDQRKRRSTAIPHVIRPSTKTRRRIGARRTANDTGTSNGNMEASAETIDVVDGVEEVVDLTCEGSECAVVDLTNNDSVLLLDEGPQSSRVTTAESYVVSSDEDDNAAPVLKAAVLSIHASSTLGPTPGTISCPICLDSYCEIVDSGRLVVSTKCGHVFCSQCLRDALASSRTCPTCRKRLTHREYHPLYV